MKFSAEIMELKITPAEKLIMALIWNFYKEGNVCYMAKSTVAYFLGIDERTVQRAYKSLSEKGHIKLKVREGNTNVVSPSETTVSKLNEVFSIKKEAGERLFWSIPVPILRRKFGKDKKPKFLSTQQKLILAHLFNIYKKNLGMEKQSYFYNKMNFSRRNIFDAVSSIEGILLHRRIDKKGKVFFQIDQDLFQEIMMQTTQFKEGKQLNIQTETKNTTELFLKSYQEEKEAQKIFQESGEFTDAENSFIKKYKERFGT